MTKIDFYVLATEDFDAILRFTCRLVGKARQQDNKVFINLPDPALAQTLDDLLWTFDQNSFIAHDRLPNSDKRHPTASTVISSGVEPIHDYDLIINLSDKTPLFFSRFKRMVEVINNAPNSVEAGRLKFRFYRDRGYPLETHKI